MKIDKNVRITLLSGVIVGLETPAWVPSHPRGRPQVLLLNIGISKNTAGKPHAPANPNSTRKAWLWKLWESVKVIDTRGEIWKMLETADSYLGMYEWEAAVALDLPGYVRVPPASTRFLSP